MRKQWLLCSNCFSLCVYGVCVCVCVWCVCVRSQANDLALLIARMQHNADQVEKNVLKAEELLAAVRNTHTYIYTHTHT